MPETPGNFDRLEEAGRNERILKLYEIVKEPEFRGMLFAKLKGNELDVEDVTQTVLDELMEKTDLPSDEEHLKDLVKKTAKFRMIDLLRRKNVRNRYKTTKQEEDPGYVNWKRMFGHSEAVHGILKILDPVARAILTEHYLNGHSLKELVDKNLGGKIFRNAGSLQRELSSARKVFLEKYGKRNK